MRRLLVLALIGGFYLTSGYVIQSVEEDNEYPPHYEVHLWEGKQLTLADYTNRKLYFPRWYYEGRLLTDPRCRVTQINLVCPSVSLHDSGRYELVATDRNDRRYLVMSVQVTVTRAVPEPRVFEPVSRFVEEVERVPARQDLYYDDCFCSGITGRCRMAEDLYRSVHNFNLSSAEPIERILSATDTTPERCIAIPGSVWAGNLITSYGGYLRFPVTNECYVERTKPCIILADKHGLAIGHFLPPRHDKRPLSVHMKESSWKLLNATEESGTQPDTYGAAPVDKFTFMSVLSHIHTVYIRGRYRSHEDNVLSIDLASPYDEGLGKVSTVEECLCHRGYAGLSCERCERGYTRDDEMISSTGVCISLSDLWRSIKRKYNVD
ncbi:laminin subunit alpha-1-like [Anopheles ziemanni]|uniref:laminin subunit alpha-1-like n=1 Tax=Anopheles coustani TaxID=139045 RepID=UPI00265ADC23|nr:laminin subunit alpha-1-like [Anopheles coustani]XP_058170287.1 laminin subunit alpha-1-like [Anopheles ziemanni]